MRVIKKILIIILILIIISLVVFTVIPFFVMKDMLDVKLSYEYIDPAEYEVESDKVFLETEDGLKIASYFVESEQPRGAIVLVSGIHNPPVCAFYSYAKMFKDLGYSTLLVEMRSHGESEGEGISAGFNEWLDVKAGAVYLDGLDKYNELPIIAYGTSMGASTVLIAAAEVEEIDGVISASAYSKWSDVAYYSMVEQMDMPKIIATLEKPFFDLHLGIKYGLGKMKYTPINQISNIDKPILLMHSTGDTQVPYSCFEKLKDNAKENERLYTYTLDGNYHFVCRDEFFEAKAPEQDKDFYDRIKWFVENSNN